MDSSINNSINNSINKNNMKKTDRKNKTNLNVTWPTEIFTIKDLNKSNPDFVEITLRVRLKKAIDAGEVNDVGVIHNGKGRPTIVFAYGPVTEQHVEQAKRRQTILKDNLCVKVMEVTNQVDNNDTDSVPETVSESTLNKSVTV
jgi:hypothetical protein